MSYVVVRSIACLTVALLPILASCGGDARTDTTTPSTTKPGLTASSTQAPTDTTVPSGDTATTTTTPSPEDPFAQFLTYTEIAWEGCELLPIADGSSRAACGFRTHPFFENWLVEIQYEIDDQGTKTGVFGNAIGGYGPLCEWSLQEGDAYAAPLVDGVATYEGVLLGSGSCDGLQWSFTQVWDDNALTVFTSGVIEPRE